MGSIGFNPLGPPFDLKGKKQDPFFPFTRISCGNMDDYNPDSFDGIDCGEIVPNAINVFVNLGVLNG